MTRTNLAGYLSTFGLCATLLPLAGCGLIHVKMSSKSSGGSGVEPVSHAPKKSGKKGAAPQAAPQTASHSTPPAAPPPMAPGETAVYDPAAQAKRDEILAEQRIRDRGTEVTAQLEALTLESKQIRKAEDPFVLATAYMIQQKMGFLFLWVTSNEGTAYRNALTPQERAAYDAKTKAALSEYERIDTLAPKKGAGSGATASASSGRSSSSSSAADDSAQRRSACLSSCERSCPSPSGSGDEWTRTNAAYSQCRNEISSCRMGCP